jgi:hypothetical protein
MAGMLTSSPKQLPNALMAAMNATQVEASSNSTLRVTDKRVKSPNELSSPSVVFLTLYLVAMLSHSSQSWYLIARETLHGSLLPAQLLELPT